MAAAVAAAAATYVATSAAGHRTKETTVLRRWWVVQLRNAEEEAVAAAAAAMVVGAISIVSTDVLSSSCDVSVLMPRTLNHLGCKMVSISERLLSPSLWIVCMTCATVGA